MATAPRPGKAKQDAAEQAHITFELVGKQYTIRPAEIPASLAREYRRETGGPFRADVQLLANDGADIDTLQNLVWLARRQSGEKVTLDDIDDFTYEQSESLKFLDDPTEDEDSPEVSAGG